MFSTNIPFFLCFKLLIFSHNSIIFFNFFSLFLKIKSLSTYWCAFADFERVHGSPETVVALYNMASKCRAEPIEQIEWALEEYENSMKKKKESHQSVTVDNEFVDDDENVDDKVVVDEEMNNSSKIDSSTLDQTSNLITLRYWPTSTMKYIRNCCKVSLKFDI